MVERVMEGSSGWEERISADEAGEHTRVGEEVGCCC